MPTPTGLRRFCVSWGHNPVGVDNAPDGFPRVARSSQPWAKRHNPVGIDREPRRDAYKEQGRAQRRRRSGFAQGNALIGPEPASDAYAKAASRSACRRSPKPLTTLACTGSPPVHLEIVGRSVTPTFLPAGSEAFLPREPRGRETLQLAGSKAGVTKNSEMPGPPQCIPKLAAA